MRRKEFEISEIKEIQEILDMCEYGVLSLVDLSNKPYSVPISFFYYDNNVYFHSAKNGKKVDIIRENPIACFVAVKPYSFLPSYFKNEKIACFAGQAYASVYFEGKITEIKDNTKKCEYLNILMKKYQPEGGYDPIEFEDVNYTKSVENIILFQLKTSYISAKFKFDQHRSKDNNLDLISKLKGRGTTADLETAKMIEKFSINNNHL
ncbi:pyridoxamine 5'-phosphate oxidase family protein [Thermodesulfobium sp. 4217-1]|uniref:pyridoxamine 5'-phosphate oxidase family protein n=1 Tax=Thermodesulfobium sp. 4217-1 TaxID=3120013 RepID=UPI0032214D7F